ncbi:MAG: DUF188 domain-containing protein [Spirochaetaceae bacterium]|jgi:uncharacterized protein YaiI (UPF0178 family)|nr:DUF188 domain-containing protein [Spirochaetaceae bacterium]
MTIWADADSMPQEARQMLIRFSLRRGRNVFFVANRDVPLFTKNPLVGMVVTGAAENAADDYIAEHAAPGDVAVTRDIPLAARLVKKGLAVLSDRGVAFTGENIGERLSARNFAVSLVNMGVVFERPRNYGKKELERFANTLEKILAASA